MSRWLRRIPYILLLFMLLFAASGPALYADTAQVKNATLNVRSGPGLQHDVITQIQKGSTYPIVATSDNWLQIDLGNQAMGWVADWLVDIAPTQAAAPAVTPTYVEANVPILNARSGPSTSFAIVDKIAPGKTYLVLDAEGEWVQIELSATRSGWVAAQYTEIKSTHTTPTDTTPNLPTQQANTANESTVHVTVDVLNLRQTPDLDATIVQKLTKGTRATRLATSGVWDEIKLADGTQGWVFNAYIATTEGTSSSTDANAGAPPLSNASPPTDASIKILTTGTNLRKGPSTNEDVIEKAAEGARYSILQTIGEWFQIDIGKGRTAYVAGWVVAAEGVPPIVRDSMSNALLGKTIVVDAGHGGVDRGAEGVSKKTKEKEVNLIVAKLVAKKLEAAGATVILTRANDTYISLQSRVDVATENDADAFISIHHNSYKTSAMVGSMTFYYTNTADKELAKLIQADLIKHNGLKDLGARKGDYLVLRENPKPSVLVELGFLSNANEEATIRTTKFQENSAEGIFQGIVKYFVNSKKN